MESTIDFIVRPIITRPAIPTIPSTTFFVASVFLTSEDCIIIKMIKTGCNIISPIKVNVNVPVINSTKAVNLRLSIIMFLK